ncbi:MAG: hypothetical protein JOS17DRAFT_616459 [Linnemannia elongata]|nr:MAG: hypothetical protein JOS17DRAFT_616459 [Linnemannia elongata]
MSCRRLSLSLVAISQLFLIISIHPQLHHLLPRLPFTHSPLSLRTHSPIRPSALFSEATSSRNSSPSRSGSSSSGSLQSSSSPSSSTPPRVPGTSPDSSSTRPQSASGVISSSNGNVTRSSLLLDHSHSTSNNNNNIEPTPLSDTYPSSDKKQ